MHGVSFLAYFRKHKIVVYTGSKYVRSWGVVATFQVRLGVCGGAEGGVSGNERNLVLRTGVKGVSAKQITRIIINRTPITIYVPMPPKPHEVGAA